MRWPFHWVFESEKYDPFNIEMVEVTGAMVVRYLKAIGWKGKFYDQENAE